MTNAEKYRDKILSVGHHFRLTKKGEVAACEAEYCKTDCEFCNSASCMQARVRWLLELAKQSKNEVIAVLDKLGGKFAVLKETGEVAECKGYRTYCVTCEFENRTENCAECRYKWLRENGFIKEE